ncbi:MAG: hypothetical protein EB051_00805 [Chlamydiia bacterium]|nr:hypothetical protein [Chlamydiia bacterium]
MSSISSIPSVKCCKVCPNPNQETLKSCSRCKSAWYCSRQCQQSDWKKGGHKFLCGQVTPGSGQAAFQTQQVAEKAFGLKKTESWQDVKLSQDTIDDVVKGFVERMVQQIVKQLPSEAKPMFPEEVIRGRFIQRVLEIAGDLVPGATVKGGERHSKVSPYVYEMIDTWIAGSDLEKHCVPEITKLLINAKKNVIFCLQSEELFNSEAEKLKSFMHTHPSTSSANRYFQSTLLPILAQERRQIAQANQDTHAREFGQWRTEAGILYSSFMTPLDIEHAPYNEYIAQLFNKAQQAERKGGTLKGVHHQAWSPEQLRGQNFLGPLKELWAKEERELSTGKQTSDRKRYEDLVLGQRPELGTKEARAQLFDYMKLFPRTHEQLNTRFMLQQIAVNQQFRFEGPAKIDAFIMKQTGSPDTYPDLGPKKSQRHLARLELEDPSNKSIFWMTVPEQRNEWPVVYLQHSNICDSKEIMDTVVDPLFLEIVRLDQTETPDFINTLKARVGRFVYSFAQASPYVRGSAAIAEWCEAICYKFHGLEYTRLPKADCEALTLSETDFLERYMGSVKVFFQG